MKGNVYNTYFCELQTASWEHTSEIEVSQNKNKMSYVVPAAVIQKYT